MLMCKHLYVHIKGDNNMLTEMAVAKIIWL